jgi:ubiquitin carboxyl-terminal hydrolase 7
MQTRGETCRTRDLTVSFGWGSIESFQQHDIQEFLRVLIENIENKLAGTEHKDAIANLLRGTQQHTIRSRDRLFKHKGSEFFYDLSLQVKDLANLHDSLARSIRPERLDDLYDAGEGFGRIRVEVQVKLLELPKVLQLHLKRFEYDFHSLTQVKVDDRFEFPEQLNMASYLARKAPPQCSMYQLFGVLVHYGTAIGGHYYAYLRPNCGAKWFKFNDSLVTEADSQKAIRENFGGDLYGSRTTYFSYQKIYSAYMLFYVRNDAVSEVFCPVSDDLPAHIKKYADERWGVLGTRTITGMNRFSVYTE